MPQHMWVPRTSEEVNNWHAATKREARTHGLLMAGLVWAGITALLAGGWIAGGRAGVIAQNGVAGGTFWTRVPIFAVLAVPFAFWLFRRESRRELERAANMTICPQCDTAGELNTGAACDCGGTFVLQSTVRWVDETDNKT